MYFFPFSRLPMWRFLITGAEFNREIKVWCTVTWSCLQTIRYLILFSQHCLDFLQQSFICEPYSCTSHANEKNRNDTGNYSSCFAGLLPQVSQVLGK